MGIVKVTVIIESYIIRLELCKMERVIKYKITSRFRDHEWFRKNPHNGLDFKMESGTPLHTIQDGTVVRIVDYGNQNLGKGVFIQWEDGRTSIYGHLSKFADIKVGDKLQTGDLIGYSGNSGFSTGSHLHFAIKDGSTFIDPEPYADLIQNMDRLKAVVENSPLPDFKLTISDFLMNNKENLSDLLNMLKVNFINILSLFDDSTFMKSIEQIIQLFL